MGSQGWMLTVMKEPEYIKNIWHKLVGGDGIKNADLRTFENE